MVVCSMMMIVVGRGEAEYNIEKSKHAKPDDTPTEEDLVLVGCLVGGRVGYMIDDAGAEVASALFATNNKKSSVGFLFLSSPPTSIATPNS